MPHPVETTLHNAQLHLISLQALAAQLEAALAGQGLTPEQRRSLAPKICDLIAISHCVEYSLTQSWEQATEWRTDPLLHPDHMTAAQSKRAVASNLS